MRRDQHIVLAAAVFRGFVGLVLAEHLLHDALRGADRGLRLALGRERLGHALDGGARARVLAFDLPARARHDLLALVEARLLVVVVGCAPLAELELEADGALDGSAGGLAAAANAGRQALCGAVAGAVGLGLEAAVGIDRRAAFFGLR